MKKIMLGLIPMLLAGSLFAGGKVIPLKSSIAEESFQTYIVNEALKELGYQVEPIKEVAYAVAYQTMAQNSDSDDVYFLATNWDPLHESMYQKVGGDKKLFRKGVFVENCAQGYLIDKKTADKYNIKYINDLKDPKIAKLFDANGDGKADLAGCNPGWGCEKVIEYQLDKYNLRGTVTHNQGEYSAIIADTIARYKKGEPILYYTWTPYWVSGVLVPGKDTTWLQVTHSANPNTKSTKLPNGMDFGFNVNNQRIVANKSVVRKHPDIAKLFSIMKLSVNDISGENMLVANGQNKDSDMKKHAKMWISQNRATFDKWLKEAKAAK
ncbi:glycine betaine/L-proline ABC transporter substrate-binding protein ProX [Sulfurospirillum sp. 1307]|jgi:glycine betaine/proline transport system substrate-binding protein